MQRKTSQSLVMRSTWMILMKMIKHDDPTNKGCNKRALYQLHPFLVGSSCLSSSLKSSKCSSSLIIDLPFSALFLVEFFLFSNSNVVFLSFPCCLFFSKARTLLLFLLSMNSSSSSNLTRFLN